MAQGKHKKPTQYQKEVKRIKRQMKALEKRGYILDQAIPKTLQGARNLTLDKLYKKAQYVDKTTGEVIKGTRGRELERSLRGKKASATRKMNLSSGRPNGDKYSDEPAKMGEIAYDNFMSYAYDLLNIVDEVSEYKWDKTRTQQIPILPDDLRNDNRRQILDALNVEVSSNGENGINIVGKRLWSAWADKELDYHIDNMLHSYSDSESNASTRLLLEVIVGRNLTSDEAKLASNINEERDYATELI